MIARFRLAQGRLIQNRTSISIALREISVEKKKSGHWIWYTLPQLIGVNPSLHPTNVSKQYEILSFQEACGYLLDRVEIGQDKTLSDNYLDMITAIDDVLSAPSGPSFKELMGDDGR